MYDDGFLYSDGSCPIGHHGGISNTLLALMSYAKSLGIDPLLSSIPEGGFHMQYPYDKLLWELTMAWNSDKNCFAEEKEFASSISRDIWILTQARKYKIFFSSKLIRLLFRILAEFRQFLINEDY